MNNTTPMTETQVRNAARKIARKAQALRNKGRHAEADKMVNEATANVTALRAAGKVVA
jgi:hypothetical protein